jgi:hypothetical protein
MTHLTIQNMNGTGKVMRRRLSPPRIFALRDFGDVDSSPMDNSDLGLDPKGLSPNYAPWWTQLPLEPGEVTTQRGTPTPGEARIARSAYWKSSPLTPNNDARDLPVSFTGKPLQQLPRQNYPGSFPHTWMPYEDQIPATGPEMGPQPSGWSPIPGSSQGQAAAENGGQPVPWVAEDQMTHDISGFASLHDIGRIQVGQKVRHRPGHLSTAQIHQKVLMGMAKHAKATSHPNAYRVHMGQIDPSSGADSSGFVTDASLATAIANEPTGNAAASAVTQQAATAQAQGAQPDTVSQIISFGAKAATAGLQAAGKLPAPKPATPFSAAAATPFIIGGLVILAGGAAIMAARAGK